MCGWGGFLTLRMRNMWSGHDPASSLNYPASLIVEFCLTGNESLITLPGGGHLPPAIYLFFKMLSKWKFYFFQINLFSLEVNYFTILYWFCHTSTWICHRYIRVPHPEPLSTSLPGPSLWVIPVHQPQATSIMHRTWTGDFFRIWYYTCFNAILPNHPTLSLSRRVQKTVLYTCVSLAVSHTG